MASKGGKLSFRKVTWRYYCSKAGIETVQEVADRLNRKERIEVFLSASNETKVLILSSVLHSDLVDSLMRIASHFEHGKETFYYICHLNMPSLTRNSADATVAAGKLKTVAQSVNFNADGEFKIAATGPKRDVYFYNFSNHEVASKLSLRKPQFFLVGETLVPTDQILPPTHHHYCDFNFVLGKESEMDSASFKNDSKKWLSKVGEFGKNLLIYAEVAAVLEAKNFIVTGNRSVMVHAQKTLPVSTCYTSRPDLIAFHPKKATILYVEEEGVQNMDEEIGEAETEKGLEALVQEHKDDDTDDGYFQQLLGGVEKAIGEQAVKYLKGHTLEDDVIFTFIDVYCLTLFHNQDTVMVRKARVDFANENTNLLRGQTVLTKEDAINRVIAKLE